ncbi:MAG: hypothetical protein IPJ65_37700 [Archangiaceae bacterium]|nr:hypothetical protein [Archangiaceae bacterium]
MWKTTALLFACACSTGAPPLHVPLGSAEMVPLAERVYAEPGLSADEHRALLEAHRQAAARIDEVFGPLPSPLALTFFCKSAACKLAFDADLGASASSPDLGFARDGVTTTSGWQVLNVVIVTTQGATTARTLTHELVHATMKNWARYDASPTWFNEGMAVVIAGGPECPSPFDPAFDVTTLDTKETWQAHLQKPGVSTRDIYCQARDAAAKWAARYREPRALGAALRARLSALARSP